MADTNYEGWTRYYSEFADILKSYKNCQAELIAKVKQAFDTQGVHLPKLDSGVLTEMDPFRSSAFSTKESLTKRAAKF